MYLRPATRSSLWLLLLLAVACDDPSANPDGGASDAETTGACTSDSDCDDGLFCNGPETCAPEQSAADSRGCLSASPACRGEACNEESDSCPGEGCENPDADEDGHDSIACGGDDCDDDDADRFPTNPEVCDDRHDEDCDPQTFGPDLDGDGFVGRDCCNGSSCGRDCDDASAGVRPDAPDGCGGGDEDCDGRIDEEPDSTFYRDMDSDTYGVEDDTVRSCSLPPGYSATSGDCADMPTAADRAINPGAVEICDGIDNDCDGDVDADDSDIDACSCTIGAQRICMSFPPELAGVGRCVAGMQTCGSNAMWGPCDDIGPIGEACNDVDDDCDGPVDEDAGQTWYFDNDDDGVGGDAMSIRACDRPSGNYELSNDDCDDFDDERSPNFTERCDEGMVDENCDQRENEGCECYEGEVRTCGPASGGGFNTTGECATSQQVCLSNGDWPGGEHSAGACPGAVFPITPEDCGGTDRDCDGRIDEATGPSSCSDRWDTPNEINDPGVFDCDGSCTGLLDDTSAPRNDHVYLEQTRQLAARTRIDATVSVQRLAVTPPLPPFTNGSFGVAVTETINESGPYGSSSADGIYAEVSLNQPAFAQVRLRVDGSDEVLAQVFLPSTCRLDAGSGETEGTYEISLEFTPTEVDLSVRQDGASCGTVTESTVGTDYQTLVMRTLQMHHGVFLETVDSSNGGFHIASLERLYVFRTNFNGYGPCDGCW